MLGRRRCFCAELHGRLNSSTRAPTKFLRSEPQSSPG